MKRIRYTEEQRAWAIEQMMPPLNRTVMELVKVTGVTAVTLRAWQAKARAEGRAVPGDDKQAEGWCSSDKFRIVLETAPLSQAELAAYCRAKGIYPEQIAQWRLACERANAPIQKPAAPLASDASQARRIVQLERALKKKAAALTEAEALLVLQKKAAAIWGQDEEE